MGLNQIPKWAAIASGVVAAGAVTYAMMKRSESASESTFETLIRDMIIDGVAENSSISRERINKSLKDLTCIKDLESVTEVMRIDMRIIKPSPDTVNIDVTILLRGKTNPKKVNVKKTLGWSDLPDQYREKLMQTNGQAQYYLIYKGSGNVG